MTSCSFTRALRKASRISLALVALAGAHAPSRAVASTPGAENAPPLPRLTPNFLNNPPRLELCDDSGAVVRSYPLLKEAGARNPALAISVTRLRKAPTPVPVHITNPAGTVLYVLQSARKAERLSAFDLNTGAALGNVNLSAATRLLQFAGRDSRLMAYGPGMPLVRAKEQKMAVITVLDPATLQVKFVQRFPTFTPMMRYVSKLDRMVVLDATRSTMWFVDPQAAPAPAIKLRGMADGAVVSADGTRLLTLVRNTNKSGKKAKKGGALNQFDLATGKLLHTSEKLEDAVQLIRLGEADEYWVLLHGRMQRVTSEGEPTHALISYQKEDKELGLGLGGIPGPSVAFGKQFAISILKTDGSLAHKVALIEPEPGRVDSVTTVGRPGVRRGKAAKREGLAIAITAAFAAAGAAGGAATHTPLMARPATPIFLPGSASRVSGMVVSPDEKTLYVLDVESEDVTALKSDGAVAAVVPIKSGDSAQLWRPAKSPFVYHVGKSVVSVIDPAQNKIVKDIPIEKGFSATLLSNRNEFYLCDTSSCEIWDAVTATSAQKLDRRRLNAYLAHADDPLDEADGQDAEETKAEAEKP